MLLQRSGVREGGETFFSLSEVCRNEEQAENVCGPSSEEIAEIVKQSKGNAGYVLQLLQQNHGHHASWQDIGKNKYASEHGKDTQAA